MGKILVIEDDEELCENLTDALELETYKTVSANNGEIGIQIAKEQKPDLIICDLNIPIVNGFGVIIELQKHELTASIPIILLSAKSDKTTIDQGLELGVVAYVTKPYRLNELLQLIQNHIIK